ncbi:MAG: PAS domain S-box protein [Desulfatibacillaceae bacterium]
MTHHPRSLRLKLSLAVGAVLLATILAWSWFHIRYEKDRAMSNIARDADRLSDTIKLGTHYAMMLNSRDDINQIINNISRRKDILNIRIYNKQGEIKFSNNPEEVDRETNIRDEACYICHETEPPKVDVSLEERVRFMQGPDGTRQLGIITSIPNEPGCSSPACHVHSPDQQILGAMDVAVSLAGTERQIAHFKEAVVWLAAMLFLASAAAIFLIVNRFVNRPIHRLILGTRHIAGGDYETRIELRQNDEMGELAQAINRMSSEIGAKQAELDRQREEYQNLFELVPCLITVQDREYRLIRYNREFERKFSPRPLEYCYTVYKGRETRCEGCPVEKTFRDGRSHYGEQSGMNRDGTESYWLTKTSPMRDSSGRIVAAMEVSLDITHLKLLESRLAASEEKYHTIFNNIPNPVFVMDAETLTILDCNESVLPVYGLERENLIGKSFLELYRDDTPEAHAAALRRRTSINQVWHRGGDERKIVVNLRVAKSEYAGNKVYLVTASDITKRLEAEQQLIQASKLATLGEMATGIAHELNQPLSVIRTASSFLIRKIDRDEPIQDEVSHTMLTKIDSNVERATRIIDHMRQFARKSDMDFEPVQVNDVLRKAFDIFNQQLRTRGIEVFWDLDENLPPINAEPSRLEQVFINLLLNARDAIEQRWENVAPEAGDKQIKLVSRPEDGGVAVEVCDTGIGIGPGLAEKIFEPFFTTKEVGKGTGIGLSISYGIVKECGGTITARNNESGGACFVLAFPGRGEEHVRKQHTAGG